MGSPFLRNRSTDRCDGNNRKEVLFPETKRFVITTCSREELPPWRTSVAVKLRETCGDNEELSRPSRLQTLVHKSCKGCKNCRSDLPQSPRPARYDWKLLKKSMSFVAFFPKIQQMFTLKPSVVGMDPIRPTKMDDSILTKWVSPNKGPS